MITPYEIIFTLIDTNDPSIRRELEPIIDEKFWVLLEYTYWLFGGITISKGLNKETKRKEFSVKSK